MPLGEDNSLRGHLFIGTWCGKCQQTVCKCQQFAQQLSEAQVSMKKHVSKMKNEDFCVVECQNKKDCHCVKGVKNFLNVAKIKKHFGEKIVYDPQGQMIYGVDKNDGITRIADVRGWGAIQQLFKDAKGNYDLDKAGEFQDKIGQFIADAINEKLERDA